MAKMAFKHEAGTAMECLSVSFKCFLFSLKIFTPHSQIPITLHKEKDYDQGREVLKCGFKIGGGIDQDYKKSPQGYTDYVSYSF